MDSPRHFAVDFDGTAADHGPEWKDERPALGKLRPWFIHWLPLAIAGGHKVTIFTARDEVLHPAISQYILSETGYDLPVTSTKLKSFDLIIDDRAIRYSGEHCVPEWMFAVEPWWKTREGQEGKPPFVT